MKDSNERFGNILKVVIIAIVAIVSIFSLVFVSTLPPKEVDVQPVVATETSAEKEVSSGSNILATTDKLQNFSAGTIVMYDYIEGEWSSDGQLLLIITSNEKEVTGLITTGEEISIPIARVKYIYDPAKVAEEYNYTVYAFTAQLAANLAKKK